MAATSITPSVIGGLTITGITAVRKLREQTISDFGTVREKSIKRITRRNHETRANITGGRRGGVSVWCTWGLGGPVIIDGKSMARNASVTRKVFFRARLVGPPFATSVSGARVVTCSETRNRPGTRRRRLRVCAHMYVSMACSAAADRVNVARVRPKTKITENFV